MNESKLQTNIYALREFIHNNGWSIIDEKQIQSGYQLVVTDGITRVPVALFHSGKALIQGKPGELQTKLKTWHNERKSASTQSTASIARQSSLIDLPTTSSTETFTGKARIGLDVSKGIQKAAPKVNEPVLITGAGTIGLLTVFMLKAIGVQTVDVVESQAQRRTLALQLGARLAITPQDITRGNVKYSVAFECSSRNQAFELLQAKMERQGRICILSDGNIEPLIVTPAFHEKELMLNGSSDGTDYQEHAKWFFSIVSEYSKNLAQLFEYQTTADYLITTFELLATGAIMPIKVLVRYNTENTKS